MKKIFNGVFGTGKMADASESQADPKDGATAKGDKEDDAATSRKDSPEDRRQRRKRMRMMFHMMGDRFGSSWSDDDDDDDFDDADIGDDEDDFKYYDRIMRKMHERRLREKQRERERRQRFGIFDPPPTESRYDILSREQREWVPPEMVLPNEVAMQGEEEQGEGVKTLGRICSDARIYTIEEQKENSGPQMHYLLKMPSTLPGNFSGPPAHAESCTYNILMADVSASMCSYWDPVVSGWNKFVAQNLPGRTDIFVFGTTVDLRRTTVNLTSDDFHNGNTDLTGALQKIIENVYKCKELHVKVFIITDGEHNASDVQPNEVIEKMNEPEGKVCDVYLLGIGKYFPVELSVNIRSRLHNGSANLPTLFWAKECKDIEAQLEDIGKNLSNKNEQRMRLSVPGCKLPGGEPLNVFHVREWVYFTEDPIKDGALAVSSQKFQGELDLPRSKIQLSLLSDAIRQWNGVVIQLHNKKIPIPKDYLSMTERLFKSVMSANREANTIAERLNRIEMKTAELEFMTNRNKIKDILTTEKFVDSIELAQNILSTTVSGGKYEVKTLQLKGHTDEDYEKDCREFLQVYESSKPGLLSLTVTPEECCRITLNSMISDFQDEDFSMLLQLNKYEFLKQFTISGIPVFAPVKDCANLNPWAFSIRGIVEAPYTIMSQVALENCALQQGGAGDTNKDVLIKQDNPKTRFNAVIPVFSPEAVEAMKPIVQTRLFAMCATYAILKNPYMIDYNIHMAALGICWVRILFENPEIPRPEYVQLRMRSILATASAYMTRKSYVNYCNTLRDDTLKALMTESTLYFNEKPLKCETLIKPMFLLYLMQQSQSLDKKEVEEIMRLILVEYVGRCLSRNTAEKDNFPFTEYFVESKTNQSEKREWMQAYVQETIEGFSGSKALLLSEFYTLEEAQNAAQKATKDQVNSIKEKLQKNLPIKVNMGKVETLRDVSLAGDVSWPTLKTYARDVGLSEDVIAELFGERNVLIYVQHALRYKNSRERLEAKIDCYEDALELVHTKVQKENVSALGKELVTELINSVLNTWLTAYDEAHRLVVTPMSKQQILQEATERGIEVTEQTFDQVYRKYRPHLGLLSNACQSPTCPFYLQPSKRYNQHAVVERRRSAAFTHGLHQVAYDCRNEDLHDAMAEYESGTHRKREGQGVPVPLEDVQFITRQMEQLKDIYSETIRG